MKKLLFALPVAVLLAAGCNSNQPAVENQPNNTQQTQNQQTTPPSANTQATPPAQQTASTSTPTLTDKTANWKVYTSGQYNYSFKYPSDWALTDNGSTMDDVNKILSLINVNKGKQNFDVRVDQNKPQGYIYTATKKASVTVNGAQYTAYVFPNGYECYDNGNATASDCSTFYVPINKNGVWYIISARGQAGNVNNEPYKTILENFKFTK
jgi:hypothetical protein